MGRYLKSFNESDFYVSLKGDNLQDELDAVCEQFLVTLLDDGFIYDVKSVWNGEFVIRLFLPDFVNSGSAVGINKLFDYTDVMDSFIPLVSILSRRYELSEFIYFYSTKVYDIDRKVFSVKQIMDDKKPDFFALLI